MFFDFSFLFFDFFFFFFFFLPPPPPLVYFRIFAFWCIGYLCFVLDGRREDFLFSFCLSLLGWMKGGRRIKNTYEVFLVGFAREKQRQHASAAAARL